MEEAFELEVDWSGDGPDAGKDLSFTDIEKGSIGQRNFKWLVQCRDNSVSGHPVNVRAVKELMLVNWTAPCLEL